MVKQSPAYAAIVKVAGELGLPLRFTTDLTLHDRAVIERKPDTSFVWMIGECGTYLAWEGTKRSDVLGCGEVYPDNTYVWDAQVSLLVRVKDAAAAWAMLHTCRYCDEARHDGEACDVPRNVDDGWGDSHRYTE